MNFTGVKIMCFHVVRGHRSPVGSNQPLKDKEGWQTWNRKSDRCFTLLFKQKQLLETAVRPSVPSGLSCWERLGVKFGPWCWKDINLEGAPRSLVMRPAVHLGWPIPVCQENQDNTGMMLIAGSLSSASVSKWSKNKTGQSKQGVNSC